jgi:arylsulfatase A-like enzyme
MIGLIMLSCSQPKTRPNVLLIMTDQQTIHMMSAMGNKALHTPAMDQLAGSGVMFYQSYCTSPVCAPARSSIISGLMPHQTGVEWNGDIMKDQVNNMGEVFRQAGYETIWAGKWHLPESYPQRAQSKQKQIKGFDLLPFRDPKIDNWMLGSETDPPLTNAVIQYLDEYDQQQPFLLAVSYHNPHDICFYARKEGWITKEDSLLNIRHYNFDYQLPDVVGTHPENYHDLPELPPNHYPTQAEPDFIRDKRLYHQEYGLETHLAYQEFSELEWRGYLNAYYRLTEMVDEEIGRLIEGLERNGLRENTMIVFTSDHGDGAAAHQWAAKLSLYEESSKVPFIVSYQNQIPSGVIDRHHLVSQIDILPTLCDYAGIELPEVTGKSIRTIIEDPTAPWRDYLVVELADYKPARLRKGRMLRTANFKYNIYTQGNHNQQFFDLTQDPGETNNLVGQPQYADEINRHRELLQEWVLETNDNFPIAELIR